MQGNTQAQFLATAFSLSFVAGRGAAQGEASAFSAVSALPVGTIDTAGHARALRDLESGAQFVVRTVERGGRGTLYVLEAASGGSRIEVDVCQRTGGPTLVTGCVVEANSLRTGLVLTAGGQRIAFVPNALGRAMLRQ